MEGIYRGIIRGFRGSRESGIGTLLIEDMETGMIQGVPCENAPTVRALDDAFGDTIIDGHMVDNVNGGFLNQEILWSYDEFGLIFGGFTPIDTPEAEKLLTIMEGNDNA